MIQRKYPIRQIVVISEAYDSYETIYALRADGEIYRMIEPMNGEWERISPVPDIDEE